MSDYEVYPNAPVVLVAMEVRHPVAEPLSPPERRELKRALAGRVPIERSGQNIEFMVNVGVDQSAKVEEFPRFFSRDNTLSVSYRRGAVVVESTRYVGWSDFRTLAELAFDALQRVTPIDGVERIGLRYIDEIRVPEAEPDWAQWMDGALLGPTAFSDVIKLPLTQWHDTVVYGAQPGSAVVLRYGPREGFAVDPTSGLRRDAVASGPFFLVDIDSFWIPDDGTPEFRTPEVLSRADELHQPVRALFEGMITDRLREEVLRNG
jgi:uncharacterized protein (TIGR04255 family)